MAPVIWKKTINLGFSFARFKAVFPLLILLASLPLLTACSFHAPSESTVINRPEIKIIDVQTSVVMKALLQVLSKKNFKVNADRTNRQKLETEWLQDGSYRSMVQAEVLPISKYRTQLTLNLLVQKKGFFEKSWQPTDEIDKMVYKDLMNEIVIESYRVLYDKR